jgi:hypothetical protein
MTTVDDILAGGTGARFHKWTAKGDTVTGTVLDVQARQATEFQSDKPAVWPDGNPKMQILVRVATVLRDDADDDGARVVVVNGWSGQRNALAEACAAAGVRSPQPGQVFTATWTDGDGTAAAPRVFAYSLAAGGDVAAVLEAAPAAVTAPAPAAGVAADPVAAAKQLRAAGVDVSVIAGLVGLPESVVEAVAPPF